MKIPTMVKIKSLWGFFKSTLKNGFTFATREEQEYRKSLCLPCPNVRASRIGHPACGVCGCRISWRIKPSASYCPAENPRWTAVRRDFFFSEWLRNKKVI
jgi:hypothetical protein